MAWRNLWRHTRRTWLTVGAMIFSNLLLIFMISLQLGSYQMMIDNSLKPYTGHMQVQHKNYNDDQKIRNSIPSIISLADELRLKLNSNRIAARGVSFAMTSSEQRSYGLQIIGVEPRFEPNVSTLPGLIKKGKYFSNTHSAEIIIGSVLARNLRVDIGSELTLLGSGRDGSFAAGVVNVSGIFESGVSDIDRSMAQLPLGYFQDLFTMQDDGHNIVINAENLTLIDGLEQQVSHIIDSQKDLSVLHWNLLQPGLQQAIQADFTSAWFMYIVLIILVAFSVLNTQLMSVLERTHEFGIMMALGLKPGRLGALVITETFIMSSIGFILGVALGSALSYYLSITGFSYPGMEEMAGKFNLPERIYPSLSLYSMMFGPGIVFICSLLASVYPALRLFLLQPVTAMRST